MSGNAADAPGSPVERAESPPRQPGATGGSKDQVDNTKYAIQEQGTEDTYDPLKEIKSYLPNGSRQLKDDICKNEKRYKRFLLYVAQNAADSWEEIGGNLNMRAAKIQSLKNDWSEGNEQAYRMLDSWMKSDKNPTLEKLLRALIATDLVEVAKDALEKKSRDAKPVTEALLNRITKNIKDVWKFLGRYLDIDENDIHSITMDNRDNTREQARQLLMKWKQSNASRATSHRLISALEDVGKTNVARFVQEWEDAKSPEKEKMVLGFV